MIFEPMPFLLFFPLLSSVPGELIAVPFRITRRLHEPVFLNLGQGGALSRIPSSQSQILFFPSCDADG